MVFSSLLFLFQFLPLMIFAYFLAPKRLRNGVLFIGSLIFYGWGEPVYIGLLLFSTLVDFYHGKLIGIFLNKGNQNAAKWTVASSAVINLSLLGFFKYADFLFGRWIDLPVLALPIGISFYTFQTMSYSIDVYRGQAEVQDDIVAFGAYVSMFPQLVAGPIVRYHTIAGQLKDRKESFAQFSKGISYFTIGLGKKVLLANSIGALWNEIQGIPEEERTILMVWMGIAAFGLQIYFDFSGYSDMAVGLGYFFGFDFPENFNYPYASKSITDFWRRWHITLGIWFKEYVYIPLGGNQKGAARQIRNIMTVWILTGIWHGAGWNFLLWGVYFGILLLIEKFFWNSYLKKLPVWIQGGYAVILVFIGWVLFAHDNFMMGIEYYRQMFGMAGLSWANDRTIYLIITFLPLFLICCAGAAPAPSMYWRRWNQQRTMFKMILSASFMMAVLFLSVAYLVDASYNPFLYFRF